MKELYAKKIAFVEELNRALIKVQLNITNIEYRVYQHRKEGWYTEYLVITYKGGARTVRNSSGNSYSAIFEDIAKYLDHGYYKEEADLLAFENDSENWILLK